MPTAPDVDAVMRALWEMRTQRKQPWTDEEWERVKDSPVHRVSLRMLREEAVQMIEDGEFDD